MSIESEFIARLEAMPEPLFRLVGGAADFAAISDKVPVAVPAAFVFAEEEISAENERVTGPVLQRTEMDIAVVIVTRNVTDASGAAAAGDVVELKHAVRRALVGFVPKSSLDGTPVTHLSGAMIKAKAGTVWWRELFAASTYTAEGE